jgi:ZIP family zinc transporter
MAAGCMLYIASDELIPESHHCHSHMANLGILSGFIVMLVLSSI